MALTAQAALLAAQEREAVAKEKARAALVAAQEREAAVEAKAQGTHNRQEIQAFKLIDFYFPAGRKVREDTVPHHA